MRLMSSDVVLLQRGAAAAAGFGVGRGPVGTPDVTVGQAGDQEVRGQGSKRTDLAASLLLQMSVLESVISTSRKTQKSTRQRRERARGRHRCGYKPTALSSQATQNT